MHISGLDFYRGQLINYLVFVFLAVIVMPNSLIGICRLFNKVIFSVGIVGVGVGCRVCPFTSAFCRFDFPVVGDNLYCLQFFNVEVGRYDNFFRIEQDNGCDGRVHIVEPTWHKQMPNFFFQADDIVKQTVLI